MLHLNKDWDHVLQMLSFERCGNWQGLEYLITLAYWIMQTEYLPGVITEFGSANGRTAAAMTGFTYKTLHVYDSFQGLPKKLPQDGNKAFYSQGTFNDSTADNLLRYFTGSNVRLPYVHVGFFEDLTPKDIPEKISFVHFDGDFYTSTKAVLNLVYPRMVPGAVFIAHDYDYSDLPGVKLALDEFLADKPEKCSKPTPHQGLFIRAGAQSR